MRVLSAVEVFAVPVAVEKASPGLHGAALVQVVGQGTDHRQNFQTLQIEVRQCFLPQPGAQNGTGNGTHRGAAAGVVHSHDHGAVEILFIDQGGVDGAGQNLRAVVAFELLHGLHRQCGKIPGQGDCLPQQGGDLSALAELAAKLLLQGGDGLLHQRFQLGVLFLQNGGDQVDDHRAGQKSQGIAIGQGDGLGAQPVGLGLTELHRGGKEGGRNGCRNGGGVVVEVHGGFQGAGLFPVQDLHHPGVGAVAAAELRHQKGPAVVFGGLVITPLADGPFPLGHMGIADVGAHFAENLTPGHAQ